MAVGDSPSLPFFPCPSQSLRPASSRHSPAHLGPMPPPVSPGPQAVCRHVGAEAL